MINNLTIHSGANNTKANTKEYLDKALSFNHTYIEVDVRASKDHICFLSHDNEYNNIPLDTLSYGDAKKIKKDLITLDETIKIVRNKHSKLNIDIKKDDYIDDVVSCIEKNHFEDSCVISGTHLDGAKKIKKRNTKLKIIINFEESYFKDVNYYKKEYENCSPYGININYLLIDNPKFKVIKDTKIPIYAWTVDNEEGYLKCKRENITNITTNNPKMFNNDFKKSK